MKRYVFLIAYEPGGFEQAAAEVQQSYFTAHEAFSTYVAEHGNELSSAALADTDTATTVRHLDGAKSVTDGPFVETVEMIGGYYDVELPDMDHAIAAAAILPPAYAVEIRPTITITA
ncbi:YciI family protein [Nocardioides jensenii]|uniref:YciI family protein n=1 Tax=Nocardioides jensenii TaxID=1843 RepID=UPI00082D2B49|nr:YciI family protein [Nocardioides jensenii]